MVKRKDYNGGVVNHTNPSACTVSPLLELGVILVTIIVAAVASLMVTSRREKQAGGKSE